jgi:hypothetical protein
MGVLSWEKPEQVMSIEEWKAISADGQPPGVYQPNMSEADARRWKATLKYAKTEHPQVEIRKTVRGSQLLVIVALDGWKYRPSGHVVGESPTGENDRGWSPSTYATASYGVRMSTNGPLWWTHAEFNELHEAVNEARAVLGQLHEAVR